MKLLLPVYGQHTMELCRFGLLHIREEDAILHRKRMKIASDMPAVCGDALWEMSYFDASIIWVPYGEPSFLDDEPYVTLGRRLLASGNTQRFAALPEDAPLFKARILPTDMNVCHVTAFSVRWSARLIPTTPPITLVTPILKGQDFIT